MDFRALCAGCIPTEIGALQGLQELRLNRNGLTGGVARRGHEPVVYEQCCVVLKLLQRRITTHAFRMTSCLRNPIADLFVVFVFSI